MQNGSTISREGEESVGTILVFEGTLHGTIRNGDRDEPLSDQVGPTWVGAIQTLTGDLTSGLTLRARAQRAMRWYRPSRSPISSSLNDRSSSR